MNFHLIPWNTVGDLQQAHLWLNQETLFEVAEQEARLAEALPLIMNMKKPQVEI